MSAALHDSGKVDGPVNLTHGNKSVSLFHRCRLALGFRTNYDFILWIIISSFMVFFSAIRAPYLHPPTFEARSSPGEWYWLRQDPYHTGIFLHLFSVIPAGFLSIFQFVPVIRNKAVVVHHYIGYVVMFLLSLGNIGITLTLPVSMGGGDLSLYAAIVFLVIATTGAMYLAWYNIKRQQIEEHRKWMLRAMFWMGIIVTMRVILVLMIFAVPYRGGYATLWTCDQVRYVTANDTAVYEEFPACFRDENTYVGVPADIHSRLHLGSLLRLTFAAATWVAIVLHTFGVELYIHLTPKENERLRMISYHKQRAARLSPPGSAGITSDRWGDSLPWAPPKKPND
ncbi:hypothetical protein JB92DRAFT_2761044 [Gautieria morchelliformis]|nr:hypothetical protein JB92DRAFT_2761044 [Gautieria morchelliformis]